MRVLLLLVALGGVAAAHTRSVSYSSWWVSGHEARVRVRLSLLDANAIAATGDSLAAYLPAHVQLQDGDGPCPTAPGSLTEVPTESGWVAREWRVRCAASPRRARSDLLVDRIPGHIHFTRIRAAAGTVEHVLGATTRDVAVPAEQGHGPDLLEWVALGVGHILTGWDHLVFLLALVLLGDTLRRVAAVVTGFTIGHSLTLAAAALGWVTPATHTVEALIGLSIALVAVENVWIVEGRRRVRLPVAAVAATALLAAIAAATTRGVSARALFGVGLFAACYFGLVARATRPETLRWGVAGLFGLVHGFGFAGALRELTMPRERLAAALLGFNAGVELGQLAVIAALWPLLALLRRPGPAAQAALVRWGSAFAAAAGVYWAVGRTLG